jgi:acyl carrier protein
MIVVAHDWLAAPAAQAPLSIAAAPVGDAHARPELSRDFAEPQSDLEQRLSRIWTQVLGIERIGRNDDFFELGGHSLLATRVLAYVHEAFGTKLELREIFDSPTIEKMARRIAIGAQLRAGGPVNEPGGDREELEF